MGKRKTHKITPSKEKNSLHTLPLPSAPVLMFVDSSTFASAATSTKSIPKPLKPTDLPLYTRQRKCVLHCKNPKVLHKVPQDKDSLEVWRKKLRLKVLSKTHRVCGKHFTKSVSEKYRRFQDWIVPDTPEGSDIEDDSETPVQGEPKSAMEIPKKWKITRILEDDVDTRRKEFVKQRQNVPISTDKIKKDILACK